MVKIIPIPAFKDNYIWLCVNPHSKTAIVVDPGEADPVLQLLEDEALRLIGILISHHHWDHTGGIPTLVQKTQAAVYGGAKEPIPGLSHPLKEGDSLVFKEMDLSFKILDIPGHTLGHIAYYNENAVFTGDTLFTGGCGKLFEGTAEQMLDSLNKIKALPGPTPVYCGHEYTLSNLSFAKVVEPGNSAIDRRLKAVEDLRARGLPSVPSPLALELETNPFLRTDQESVIKAIEQHFNTRFSSKAQIFLAIRQWKDHF